MGNLTVITGQADQELDRYFNRAGATDLVKRHRGVEIAPKTWANWSWSRRGPRWKRFGRNSVAQGRDILAAVDAMLADNTPPQAA
jgi:hypothetical protein